MFIPTTTMTILEPHEGEDGYGDAIDEYRAVARGVGAYPYEYDKRAFDPQSGRATTVRRTRVILPPNVRVQSGSRLIDEPTGRYYHVEYVKQPVSFTGSQPIRVEVKDVDAEPSAT